ncbi:MAG: hypothetical protein V3V08_01260 [Nannocystaceae bacterium]
MCNIQLLCTSTPQVLLVGMRCASYYLENSVLKTPIERLDDVSAFFSHAPVMGVDAGGR